MRKGPSFWEKYGTLVGIAFWAGIWLVPILFLWIWTSINPPDKSQTQIDQSEARIEKFEEYQQKQKDAFEYKQELQYESFLMSEMQKQEQSKKK